MRVVTTAVSGSVALKPTAASQLVGSGWPLVTVSKGSGIWYCLPTFPLTFSLTNEIGDAPLTDWVDMLCPPLGSLNPTGQDAARAIHPWIEIGWRPGN